MTAFLSSSSGLGGGWVVVVVVVGAGRATRYDLHGGPGRISHVCCLESVILGRPPTTVQRPPVPPSDHKTPGRPFDMTSINWSVGEWGACSRSCGAGEQSRQVQCVQRTGPSGVDTLADPKCAQPTPGRRQACNTHSCPPVWSPGPWSQCSRLCGKGLRKRTVLCTSSTPSGQSRAHTLPDSSCAGVHKPSGQESCFIKRCPKQRKVQWFVSTWQETRFIKCAEKPVPPHGPPPFGTYPWSPAASASHPDRHHPAPPLASPQPSARDWYSSPWAQCTVSCGGGVQTRAVQCLAAGKPASGCPSSTKPGFSQACNTNFCPQPEKKEAPSYRPSSSSSSSSSSSRALLCALKSSSKENMERAACWVSLRNSLQLVIILHLCFFYSSSISSTSSSASSTSSSSVNKSAVVKH
ncbi:hypothetical protein CRUP_020669 [Coryphaenoides rupestris]|nr:hypothetical protein CRUP_020669 [Coryphaenoides rupestris]